MKLAIILGTRPEIIRLSQIIKVAKEHLDLVLIHTGQNWDTNLSEVFFTELGLPKPNYLLNTPGEHLGETLGNMIAHTFPVLKDENPDAVLILGDTNSSLSAIAAKRLKIPIFHMEAGNRCFDFTVPEEINRVLVDSISDINLAYTENSRRNLIKNGYDRNSVFVTGSPIPEVFIAYEKEIEADTILSKLGLEKDSYFLASIHREENLEPDSKFAKILESLIAVHKHFKREIIFSTHPRTKLKLVSNSLDPNLLSGIKFIDPVGLFSYLKLMKSAFCTITDSGTISEEASFLKLPAVTLRHTTERPEAVETGNYIVTGYAPNDIILAISLSRKLPRHSHPPDYQVTDVSSRVLKIILSYYHIVNKTVWNK